MRIEVKSVGGRRVVGCFKGDELLFEVKSAPYSTVDESADGRTKTGIFSLLGNVDLVQDQLYTGSFTKTINERVARKRVRFLWNHDQEQPPVAVVKSVRELGRHELPSEIQLSDPSITGGVEVVREYLDTPLADVILKNLNGGGLNEMSFGFIPVKFDYQKSSSGDSLYDAIRRVYELKLFEISDVHFGANDATIGVKCDRQPAQNWAEFADMAKSLKVGPEDRKSLEALAAHINKALEVQAEPAEAPSVGGEQPPPDTKSDHSLAKAKLDMFNLEVSRWIQG